MNATKTSTALLIIILILGAGVWLIFGAKGNNQAINLPASATPYEDVAVESAAIEEVYTQETSQATIINEEPFVVETEISESNEAVSEEPKPATEDDIKKAVKNAFPHAKNVVIGERSDLTGDADLEMIVATGSNSTSGNEFTVVRFEEGVPVIAKVRELGVSKNFIYDVSVGTGKQDATGIKTYPEQNTIVTTHYELFGESTDKCEARAYVWNSSDKVFDHDTSLSAQYTEQFKIQCQKIASEFGLTYGN